MLEDLFVKLQQAYAIMDNEYKAPSDVFSVHEHNSLGHHIAVIVGWYLLSWPMLVVAYFCMSMAQG